MLILFKIIHIFDYEVQSLLNMCLFDICSYHANIYIYVQVRQLTEIDTSTLLHNIGGCYLIIFLKWTPFFDKCVLA